MIEPDGETRLEIQKGAKHILAIIDFAEFVKYLWIVVEPETDLAWNWHLDLLCDALQKQMEGDPEYRKLVICVPPGSMKSLLVSVFAPAWRWLQKPSHRGLFFANDDKLVIRDSRRTREIITSERYQTLIQAANRYLDQPIWKLAYDQNEKSNFENTRRGFRQCLPIGSKVTGKRGDSIVIDDPLDAKEIVNGSSMQVNARIAKVNNTIEKVLINRVNKADEAQWTIIMQRLHVQDPAGRAMEKEGWKVINIQMEFNPENPLNHPNDPRTEHGELLFPAMFPERVIEDFKRSLGPRDYSTQYQQSPRIESGGMFKERYFSRRYKGHGVDKAREMEEVGITVDCAFKKTTDTDFVVLQVWGRKDADRYLLEQVRARMNYPETRRALLLLVRKYPTAFLKLIEEKANGSALIDDLKDHVPGLVAYDPRVSKEARAQTVLPFYEAQNLVFPEDEYAGWMPEYVEEHLAFPNGAHDDQVDASTQILLRWGESDSDPMEALKAELGFLMG